MDTARAVFVLVEPIAARENKNMPLKLEYHRSVLTRFLALLVALGAPLVLSACGARGPIEPATVESPDATIIIDPYLRKWIAIPATHPPVKTLTADGRMRFVFHLQNQSSEVLRVQYQPTFYDEAGVPVDRPNVRNEFLRPYEIQTFEVDAANPRATNVQVQVRPAQ